MKITYGVRMRISNVPEGYTQIPGEIVKERDELCTPLTLGISPSLKLAKQYTSYFMYHQMGYKPYAWQHMLFKEIRAETQDVLVNTIRQAGKTFAIEVSAIQYAIYNLKPVPSKGYTIIGIASSSEAQQKKIIEDIRDIMDVGDTHLYEKSGGKLVKWFTSHLSRLQTDSNNRTELTFRERVWDAKTKTRVATGKIIGKIKCVPATKSARGNTFSLLFMDEAAFFDEEDFFDTVARPTLKKTEGKAVITTTPNGQKGWFYRVFDPYDEMEYNPFHRMWLHYEHIEDEHEYASVLKLQKDMYMQGAEKKFQQEYEAKFTADNVAFFESDKVDMAKDDTLTAWDSYSKPTDMGIDIGFKSCPTVITISRLGDDGISRLVYDKIYQPEKDMNLLEDTQELIKQFNVQRVIVDECPAASFFIQQATKAGLPLKLMSFKKDKQKKYFLFRSKLHQGKIKFYEHKRLETEMKALTATEQQIGTKITKPLGGSDDVIDSFLMSVYFQIEDKKNALQVHRWNKDKFTGKGNLKRLKERR